MCGIAGIMNFSGKYLDQSAITKMTAVMAHRGPDSDGYYVDEELALGHRRLSIIDLSENANQPFISNDGNFVIVFNGEIYNYQEVKMLLKDFSFRTNSDTEVVLASYITWGEECFDYFKGMFAFAIWDKKKKELLIARDRLGVKPLYYHKNENLFAFASESRAILSAGLVSRKLNKKALADYYSFQSASDSSSLIDGIHQLEAGCFIKIKNGIEEKKIYWDVTKPYRTQDVDFSDKLIVQKQIQDLLLKSVERRMVSDVPVGAFLSGGIDSSAVVGLMARLNTSPPNTFNISFSEKEFDESEYAELVVKKFNTKHNKISLKPGDFLGEVENALMAMDSPSADGVNTYVVSKAIRSTGIKVALSGVGGDELFAGYPIFSQYIKLQKYRSLFKHTYWCRKRLTTLLKYTNTNRRQRLLQLAEIENTAIENFYPISRQILAPDLIDSLTQFEVNSSLKNMLHTKRENIRALPFLSQVSVCEYLGYTKNTLLKDTDQMSMAVSLEVREPFFDHELVEFMLNVPDILKFPKYPKSLLVESLGDLLPQEIVHRKKKGFLFPWNVWMRGELKDFCEKYIIQASERNFVNKHALLSYWKDFLKGDNSIRWGELWLFIVLEYWMFHNNISE